MPAATFYFDLGSPYAYLAAERLHTLLPEPVDWQPILLGGLFKANGRSSWARGEQRRREAGMEELERRARNYGLPPFQWPESWPSDYLVAMRAASFAFSVGLGREFTMCAFRAAFQRGVDLSVPEHVWQAAAQAGLDASEVEAATSEPAIKQALRTATEQAHSRGVFGVPTVAVDDELFWGDDRLEEAAARYRSAPF